jgi:hypothetical protein
MDTNTYAVIDGTGTVINLIVWDGNTTNWQPPEGCTTELVTPETVINFTVGMKVPSPG